MNSSIQFQAIVMAIVCLFATTSPAASAASRYDRERDSFGSAEEDSDAGIHSLSVAGGIAAPSATAFFGENPAGLIFNRKGTLTGYVGSGATQQDHLASGAIFGAGNGSAAASVGVQSFTNAADSDGPVTNFTFGLATKIAPLRTTLGLSGAYRFENNNRASAPENTPTWSADLGLLFMPTEALQIGTKLYGLSQGVTAGGIGIAAHISSYSVLALDMSADNHGRGMTFKPGIGVRAANLNLSYAYGMQLDKSAMSGITPGNTLGLGYDFTPKFRVMGFYNHFATYFFSATVELF